MLFLPMAGSSGRTVPVLVVPAAPHAAAEDTAEG